jgi:flagellar biosynthesis protein FlhB
MKKRNCTLDTYGRDFILVTICVVTIFCSAFNWSRLWGYVGTTPISSMPFFIKAFLPCLLAVILLFVVVFDFVDNK